MRSSRLITLDILATRKRLQALRVEMIDARLAERNRIVEQTAKGKTLQQIALTMGMSLATVQGILWRAGHSISGKRRVRINRSIDLGAMLDANMSAALRRAPAALHRAPEQKSVGRAP